MAWDAKRQFIWLATGISVGTFIVYLDSRDDNGVFVPSFFIFMELLLLVIISAMFYIYSRRKN
ncbi:MAG TPA: hypothetical protein VGN90_09165 [Pyrinomonadaceae bacterium]|jgi:hypothetical protein|nr:hypothetical protein [Pyrinomonadaceae bacterium]